MIAVALTVAGLAAVLLPAAWWAGLFLDAGRAVVRATSTALVAALPILGAGLIAFGLDGTWGPAPAMGFVLLLAFVVVLFAGATGRTERLSSAALRGQRPLSVVRGEAHERGPDRRDDDRNRWMQAPGA
jgi:hypothetical protein